MLSDSFLMYEKRYIVYWIMMSREELWKRESNNRRN